MKTSSHLKQTQGPSSKHPAGGTRLKGVQGSGPGVRVLATIQGKALWQSREVAGGAGYLSQDDLRIHFGLGDAERVENVCIEWPSGVTRVLKDLAVNQHLVVEEDPIPMVAPSFSEGGSTRTTSRGARSFLPWELTERQ